MKILNKKISVTLLIFVFGLTGHLLAQGKTEAIKAFNKGLDEAKSENYTAAINSFEKTLEIAKQIGDQDLQNRAIKQLPTMHYQQAVSIYNDFQSDRQAATLRKAISEFQNAENIAEKYNNSQIADKAQSIITQLTYNLSVLYFKQDQLDSALAAVNRAINSNANYAKAYYHKALIEKKRGNFDQFLSSIDQAINIGLAIDDQEIIETAREKAAGELIARGVKAMENKNFSTSRNYLNRALEYEEDNPNAHYRLAELSNKQRNYNEAIQHAKRALALENGGKSEKAKIYFELGLAYQGTGNKSAACGALNDAAYGSFKASAEHKMEFELKCKTLAQS